MGKFQRRLLQSGTNGVPTVSPNRSGNEPDFDTNMVIVLAVLICALIFTIGLNTATRCGLRSLISRSSSRGLKKRDLRGLPVDVYGFGITISETECPICLGQFEDGEKVRVLPKCNHGFHVGCIDTWLVLHASCPNCRVSFLETPPPLSDGLDTVVAAHSSL